MNSNSLASLNQYTPTVTTAGNVTVGSVWYEPWYQNYPNYQYPTYIYTTPTLPTYCSGEVHVFGCEHADKCKCGKAQRKPEPEKCGACGK